MDRRRPIGRTADFQRVDAFLEAMTGGPAALILAGEAGIGKTTIWSEADIWRRLGLCRELLPG